MSTSPSAQQRANSRNAFLAGFLGWTFDAFDFFILTYVLAQIAKDFHKPISDIALMLTASLMMRPVGAVLFGLLGDRYGRRRPLMVNILFYSCVEALSGLAPSYHTALSAPAFWHWHGRNMGIGRFSGDGVGTGREARNLFGNLARGLCHRQFARGRGILDGFPPLGLAPDVFPEHSACLTDSVAPIESGGK